MKFKVDVGGTTLLLSNKQLEALTKILDDTERIEDKYVGSNKGTNGTSYVKLIRSFVPSEHFRCAVMSDTEYGAMKLVTTLEDEKQ